MEAGGGDGPGEGGGSRGEGEAVGVFAVSFFDQCYVGELAGHGAGVDHDAVAGFKAWNGTFGCVSGFIAGGFAWQNQGVGIYAGDGLLHVVHLGVGDGGVWGAGAAARAVAPGDVADAAEQWSDVRHAAHEECESGYGRAVVEDYLAAGASRNLDHGIIYPDEPCGLVLVADALHQAFVRYAGAQSHYVPLHGVVDDGVAYLPVKKAALGNRIRGIRVIRGIRWCGLQESESGGSAGGMAGDVDSALQGAGGFVDGGEPEVGGCCGGVGGKAESAESQGAAEQFREAARNLLWRQFGLSEGKEVPAARGCVAVADGA